MERSDAGLLRDYVCPYYSNFVLLQVSLLLHNLVCNNWIASPIGVRNNSHCWVCIRAPPSAYNAWVARMMLWFDWISRSTWADFYAYLEVHSLKLCGLELWRSWHLGTNVIKLRLPTRSTSILRNIVLMLYYRAPSWRRLYEHVPLWGGGESNLKVLLHESKRVVWEDRSSSTCLTNIEGISLSSRCPHPGLQPQRSFFMLTTPFFLYLLLQCPPKSMPPSLIPPLNNSSIMRPPITVSDTMPSTCEGSTRPYQMPDPAEIFFPASGGR